MKYGRSYTIHQRLGKGGFGTVYRAEVAAEGGFVKPVAVKMLNPELTDADEVSRRLRDEARVLGLVRHRNIVHVDGLVRLNRQWAVVMEYVEGADVGHVVASSGPMPVGPALEITAECASALHAVYHREGPDGRPLNLIHRDLKPSNIQLTAAGEVKILDFGIARAEFADREAKTRSVMFGSMGYIAPERFEQIDGPFGDVYSLGVVLLEMIAGRALGKTPLVPEKHAAAIETVLGQAKVLPEVADLIRRMTAFDHDQRPSARDVERIARELRRGLPGEWLGEWCERVVPRIAGTVGEQDELCGKVLTEALPAVPPPAPRSSGRWIGVALAVAAMGAVGLALVFVAVLLTGALTASLMVVPSTPNPASTVLPAASGELALAEVDRYGTTEFGAIALDSELGNFEHLWMDGDGAARFMVKGPPGTRVELEGNVADVPGSGAVEVRVDLQKTLLAATTEQLAGKGAPSEIDVPLVVTTPGSTARTIVLHLDLDWFFRSAGQQVLDGVASGRSIPGHAPSGAARKSLVLTRNGGFGQIEHYGRAGTLADIDLVALYTDTEIVTNKRCSFEKDGKTVTKPRADVTRAITVYDAATGTEVARRTFDGADESCPWFSLSGPDEPANVYPSGSRIDSWLEGLTEAER